MEEKKNIMNIEENETGTGNAHEHGEKIDDSLMEKVNGGTYNKGHRIGKIHAGEASVD